MPAGGAGFVNRDETQVAQPEKVVRQNLTSNSWAVDMNQRTVIVAK